MSGGYGGSGGDGGGNGNGNYPNGNPSGGGQWNQGGMNPQYPYQAPQPVPQYPQQQYPFHQQPIPQHQQNPQNPDHFRETVAPGMKLFGQSLGLSFGFFLGIVLIFVFIPMLLCGGCVAMGMFASVADSVSNSRDTQDWRDIDEPLNSGFRNDNQNDTGPRVLPGGGIDSGR